MLTSDIFLPPGKFAATGPTVYVGRLRDYCFCARPLMGGKSQNRRVICWPLAYKRAWGGVQEILFGLLLLLLLLSCRCLAWIAGREVGAIAKKALCVFFPHWKSVAASIRSMSIQISHRGTCEYY